MAYLKNSQADLVIGVTSFGAFGQPALYVQEGKQRRVIGTFFSKEKADMFLKLLEKWDENGGSDEKYPD